MDNEPREVSFFEEGPWKGLETLQADHCPRDSFNLDDL